MRCSARAGLSAAFVSLAVALLPLAARALALVPQPMPAITILLFHQVSDHPVVSTNGGEDTVHKPWVSPAQFDAILGQAERDGYRYVTQAQARAYFLHGESAALPAKPMLLTFDDGYRNAWLEATPVLRRHHAEATMFFEGVLTGVRPDRLTIADLRAMRASGAWALASHGWMGHSNITIDARGPTNPYWYANLAWLPDRGRLETPAEFRARVEADVAHFRHAFEGPLGVPLTMFAFPSGEYGESGPLEPGGNPDARVTTHSNATGLQPLLDAALQAAGYDLAFAVSVPGTTTPASRADPPYELPRIGVGADFDFVEEVTKLSTRGRRLPELAHDRYLDPGPLAAAPDGFYVASTSAPLIVHLDGDGRELARWELPALMAGRGTRPALISGLLAEGSTLLVLQQAGDGAGAAATITTLDLGGSAPRVTARRRLPAQLDWLVGMARLGPRLVGLTDDGGFYDLERGDELARVGLPDGSKRDDRFAGPVVVDGVPYVVDRQHHTLMPIGRDGAPGAGAPLAGDVHFLTARGRHVFAVDAADNRHVMLEYRMDPT